MASYAKFDLSSSSPSGQRGSHSVTLMENPILSSLPSMSRSTSTVSRVDVNNFLQCLRFDPKSMAAEYKYNGRGDFKRFASAALGAPDDSPLKGKLPCSYPEDLKRMKVGLRESAIKARERVKIFSEVSSVFNKCFPSIPSRKRSRPDAFASDRSNGLLTVGKMGAQSHALTNAFDFEQQKVEERGKNVIPNKRTRTSMVDQRADVRPNTPARSSGTLDSDREVVRLPNGNGLQGEDRVLPMKKKRSGIKADAAPTPSSVLSKPINGCREPKQGVHSRNLPDARLRLNDPSGFRPGAANGLVGIGKAEGSLTTQIRSSIPRPEQENASVLSDKRDQSTNSEQERTNVKPLNKASAREEFISGSPSSNTKQNARGPRSGSGVAPKLSPVVQRATASNGWESSNVTSKNVGAVGPANRKRTPSTRSSSPPVTQWADRRPQKISRTARRTNLVPILSSNNDNINESVSEKGRGVARRFPPNSTKQFKSKDVNFSPSNKKSEEVEEKSGSNVQKMSTLVPPTRKNKLVNEENVVDGVRRQGRTGRGFASARSVEKIGNVGTVKRLRTARLGFDKPESRSGRPPTRRPSGLNAYTRQKQYAANVTTYLLDDGHDGLLTAAKAVINPNCAIFTSFWRHMDPLFGFLSDADLSYIKQERSKRSTVTTAKKIESCDTLSNRVMAFEPPKRGTESRNNEIITEHLTPGSSLCQRLLAALISEEENDDIEYDVYGSSFALQTDVESNGYMINSTSRSCKDSAIGMGFDHSYAGLLSDPSMIPSITCSDYEYGNMSIDEKLLLEIQSLGLYPSRVPDLVHTGDEDVSEDISRLEEKHREQVSRKKSLLDKLLKSTEDARKLHEKEFEQLSLDKLTEIAYHKYMSCWGPSAPGGKSASGKIAKQAALGFVKQTLDRCHEFEATGKSCFAEPLFKKMFLSGSTFSVDPLIDGSPMEKASGSQPSPSHNNHDIYPSDAQQTTGKNDVWSSRAKKESYLDDITGRTISNNAKGKRSEREVLPRNGAPKNGERKTKTKPKQKTTQLSSVSKPVKEKENSEEEMEELFDFSQLEIPEDFVGGQGQDISSWLNIDDNLLKDEDFIGLQVPMDDLFGLI